MKFKSWYIVLLGMIIQSYIGYSLFSAMNTNTGNLAVLVPGVMGLLFIVGSAFGIIPLILLIFRKTRKIGGLVSIALGVIGITAQIGIIVGIFLVIAGIIALWKKI